MERRDSGVKSFLRHIALGGTANIVAKTLTAPLERAKLILQTQGLTKRLATDRYTGLTNYLISVPSKEGFKAYWRGNGANIAKIFPSTLSRFWFHHRIRNLILKGSDKDAPESMTRNFVIGALSGSLALTFAYPLDLARTRLAVDVVKKGEDRVYWSTWDCLSKTTRDEGLRGLFRGYLVSLAGIVPYVGLSFAIHDELLHYIPEQDGSNLAMQLVSFFGVGSIAGVVAQTGVYPIDTLRRRMMINGCRYAPESFSSTYDCLRKTLTDEGLVGLYRGCLINIVKNAPGIGIQFTIYDWLYNDFYKK
jgi:hypothetical protein